MVGRDQAHETFNGDIFRAQPTDIAHPLKFELNHGLSRISAIYVLDRRDYRATVSVFAPIPKYGVIQHQKAETNGEHARTSPMRLRYD